MSLPGKLCIGIIEEDNPLKSYFRFKPLLVAEGDAFLPWSQPQAYPGDGCIRIVPDKNESYHFKARMRRMGLFCVVDLREHPDENDKIRPNKNFRADGEERNAFIIYSDVVREPAADAVLALTPAEKAGEAGPAPAASALLLTDETGAPDDEIYEWKPDAPESETGTLAATGRRCDLESMARFELEGFGEAPLCFLAAAPGKVCAPRPEKAEPAQPQEPPREAEPEPEAAPEAGGKPPRAERDREKEREREKAAAPDKPWICHDSSVLPRPVDPRLSPAQRMLAEQAGLNPRRGRSLQELIDEKWQHSRLNQLGHPVAQLPTGLPVVSPVDAAEAAVRAVWDQPNLRGALMEALAGIEDFGPSIDACREAARNSAVAAELDALEARRLELLGELDRLKTGDAQLRRQLKEEIRRDDADELAESTARVEAARAARAQAEAEAESARALARDARKAVDALTGEELERRVKELALNRRITESLERSRRDETPTPAAMETEDADLARIADRVEARFAAEGWSIARRDALNLVVCAALTPALFLSGPLGSGKTGAARLLSEALGWAAAGRVFAVSGESKPFHGPKPRADGPAMLLADDANLDDGRALRRGIELLRGHADWRLCATVQDSHTGGPIPANALDMGFMVRLSGDADADWRPRRPSPFAPQPPVSLDRAAAALLPQPEEAVPAACAQGLETLRKGLGGHGFTPSRRALVDAWNYCGVMNALMGEAADPEWILDMAFAQRVLPALLASAPLEVQRRLTALLRELPVSRALLRQPLPIMV